MFWLVILPGTPAQNGPGRRGHARRCFMRRPIMVQLGAGFNGYAGQYKTTRVGVSVCTDVTDVILQRSEVTQIWSLTALRGANWRWTRREKCYSGGGLMHMRGQSYLVHTRLLVSGLSASAYAIWRRHTDTFGGSYDTEARGKLVCVLKLPLRLSRVLKPKLQSRSKRLSALTNLAQGMRGCCGFRKGLDQKKKHIQMFN